MRNYLTYKPFAIWLAVLALMLLEWNMLHAVFPEAYPEPQQTTQSCVWGYLTSEGYGIFSQEPVTEKMRTDLLQICDFTVPSGDDVLINREIIVP